MVEGTPLLRVQTGNRLEGSNPFVSATCPRESVLPIRLRLDFSVVFEGYAGGQSTGSRARRLASALSGPIFSRPHDCADLVNSV